MTPIFFLVGIVVVLALLTVLTVVLALGVVGVIKPVQAQVEAKQTVTNTNNCDGLPSVCDQTIKFNGLTVTNDHGHMTIHYCKEKCHTYKLESNGTISEVR
jgi:FlaG/FlaF family flagellin (archaellin)